MSKMLMVIVATSALILLSSESSASPLAASADRNLMNFLLSSRSLTEGNPQRSLECFDYYVPVLDQLLKEYEANYNICVRDADQAKIDIDEKVKDERNDLNESAESSCALLRACTDLQNAGEFFECYADGASQNSKTMYVISANASDVLFDVRENYRLIDNEENRCTNASERAYIEKSSATYEELQSCLIGQSPVPTHPPPTESTPTPPEPTEGPTETPEAPTETTEAPVDTTEAPAESTEAPTETTEAPAESTEAPAESTEAPAESTEAPAESTEAPAESTEAPAESTEAPAESTEAPAETTEGSAESTESPDDTTEASDETAEPES